MIWLLFTSTNSGNIGCLIRGVAFLKAVSLVGGMSGVQPEPDAHLSLLNGRSWPLCRALHNGHYVECPVMNSGITESMAAAELSRQSHAQALHNYKVFRNSSKESGAW